MYHRIDPRLPRWIALDDVMSIKEIQEFGYSLDLRETFKFVDDKFKFNPVSLPFPSLLSSLFSDLSSRIHGTMKFIILSIVQLIIMKLGSDTKRM